MTKLIRLLAAAYLLSLSVFIWGFVAGKYQVFPHQLLQPYVQEWMAYFTESHQDRVVDLVRFDHQERVNPHGLSGFQRVDSGFRDSGYLLISRYSKSHGQTIVELFDLSSEEVLHTWVPDLGAIFGLTPGHQGGVNTLMAYRSQHPLLMNNGDLVIGSGEGPLVRIDQCGSPTWTIDRHFHHSIESDVDGNLVVPLVLDDPGDSDQIPFRDDGFAVISPEGSVLEEYSVSRALIDNGYRGLLFGVGVFEPDRLHLNDVQPIPGVPAREGVLLSIRNLSSVALLRPATGEIEWLQTGPWLNQHDINPLEDGGYSIFGNDIVRGPEKILGDGRSQIYVYYPESGEIITPYSEVLERVDMHTGYEGRSTVLENGDVFIEETNRDRLLRVSRQGVRWVYVNGLTESTSGALHWSRYLPANSVSIDWLEKVQCD
ncbi:MAG: aryl sulfotransferase [Porticoccaceae bacterium]|nr:aryl sulfotransferase [Porticoccaceae bacterium]